MKHHLPAELCKTVSDASYKVSANFPTLYGFQYWNKNRNSTLTSLFIDLVDTNNQKGQYFGRGFRWGTVSDPVSGYTLAEIESRFLKNVYGIQSPGDRLKKNKPAENNRSANQSPPSKFLTFIQRNPKSLIFDDVPVTGPGVKSNLHRCWLA